MITTAESYIVKMEVKWMALQKFKNYTVIQDMIRRAEKIHNLPDHVFFSHAQHIRAGKVQCQTCHGPIQQMDEVKQFAPLSMGWCINCHRTTKVDFPDSASGNEGNKFYSVYEKFHAELKSGKIDSVTVEKIGGTECQKCHY